MSTTLAIALVSCLAVGAAVLAFAALLQSDRMEARLRSIEERVGGVDDAAEEMR